MSGQMKRFRPAEEYPQYTIDFDTNGEKMAALS
jgi:hypothetical protein